jgi:hypothetical protein
MIRLWSTVVLGAALFVVAGLPGGEPAAATATRTQLTPLAVVGETGTVVITSGGPLGQKAAGQTRPQAAPTGGVATGRTPVYRDRADQAPPNRACSAANQTAASPSATTAQPAPPAPPANGGTAVGLTVLPAPSAAGARAAATRTC